VGVHHFRTAEKVALEVHKALIPCPHEFGMGFDFLRQHPAAPRTEPLDHDRALLLGRQLHFHLDDVRHLRHRFARIIGHIVVERDCVSRFFQTLAGRHHLRIHRDRFQNLHHRRRRGQQRDQSLDQRVSRAIHKRLPPIAQYIESHQQRPVERRPRRLVRVAMERIFQAVPKQQFVAEYFLIPVNDRLPRHVAQRLHIVHRGSRRSLSSRHVSLVLTIGGKPENLKPGRSSCEND